MFGDVELFFSLREFLDFLLQIERSEIIDKHKYTLLSDIRCQF